MKITITELKCESIPQFYKNGKRKSKDMLVLREEHSIIDAKPLKGFDNLFFYPDKSGRYSNVYDADGNLKFGIWRYGFSGTKDRELALKADLKGNLIRITSLYGYDGVMGKGSYARLIKIL